MYADALSFLEDERDAWLPYEALLTLPADQLAVPVVGPGQWSARDLLGHLVSCQEYALGVARELAMGERSATYEAGQADWDTRGGDVVNAEAVEAWRALPLPEVLARARSVPGELRGYLTVVPEVRWIKNATFERFFLGELLDHYADHMDDLRAILDAVGGGR